MTIVYGLASLLLVLFLPGWLLSRHTALRSYELPLTVAGSLTFIYLASTVALVATSHLSFWTPQFTLWVVAVAVLIGSILTYIRASETFSTSQLIFLIVSIGLLGFITGKASLGAWAVRPLSSDALVSWAPWARTWASGQYPIGSYGYPQLIPTLWSIPYRFLGPEGGFFARSILLSLILLPVAMTGAHLLQKTPWVAIAGATAYAIPFLALKDGWTRQTISAGFSDWAAASFVSAGAMILAPSLIGRGRNEPGEWLLALLYFALAASTKNIAFVFVIAALACGFLDFSKKDLATRHLSIGLAIVVVFALIYVFHVSHVINRTLPPFQRPSLLEAPLQALSLLGSKFSWSPTFAALPIVGAAVTASFGLRAAVFSAAVAVGLLVWSYTAAYDVRAALPFVFVAIVLPASLYAAKVGASENKVGKRRPFGIHWPMIFLTIVVFLTVPVLRSEDELRTQFADMQMRTLGDFDVNQSLIGFLRSGCRVVTSVDHLFHFETYKPYLSRMHFGHTATDGFYAAMESAAKSDDCLVIATTEPPTAERFVAGEEAMKRGRPSEVMSLSGVNISAFAAR